MQPLFTPLKNVIGKTIPIKAKYFTTYHGFIIGSDSNAVKRIYGKPQRVIKSNEYLCYQWDYPGEYFLGDQPGFDTMKIDRKRYADYCASYNIRVFFLNGKAIASELVIGEP